MPLKWGPWHLVLCALPFVAVAAAYLLFDPFPQPLAYHGFADRRSWLGIPNFADVVSNLAVLLAGGLGLHYCFTHRPAGALQAWRVFFLGVVLVAFASAYYHWAPSNDTLVWDRAALIAGFMGFYVALMSEHVRPWLEKALLAPALVLGLSIVIHWYWVDDLRLYFVLQGVVFSSGFLAVIGFESPYGRRDFVYTALGFYVLAIIFERLDRAVFDVTGGVISGHTVKHLLAGLAAYWIYRMLRLRAPAEEQ